MDPLRLEPGLGGEAAQDQEDARPRQRPAPGVQEELRAVAGVEERASAREIAAERLRRLPPERDDSLLAALADAVDEPALEVDACAVERDGLADAEPRTVEELHERPVPEPAGRHPRSGLDQPLRLARRERPRQRPSAPRQVEVGRRVVGPRAEQQLVPEERLNGGDTPADRRGGEPLRAESRDVALEVGGVGRPDGPPERAGEGVEVAPVRLDRARGAPRREQREEPV